MKQIIINSEELQVRVAVVDDGKLQDFFMERKNKDRIVGSIYKGRIKNLEPSLQAAFVDIGVGKNAFLHYWDMIPATQEMLEEGEEDEEALKQRFDAAASAPAAESAVDAEVVQGAAAEGEASAEVPAEAAAPAAEEAVAEEAAESGSVAKGLLPLTGGSSGLIPIRGAAKSAAEEKPAEAAAEPEVPAAEAVAEKAEEAEKEEESKPADDARPAQVFTATVEQELPPPRQQQMRGQGHGGKQNNQEGGKQNNQEGGKQNNQGGGRRRHRGRGNRGGHGRQQAEAAPPPKTGFFRRLCEALLPASWLKPAPVPPQNSQRPRKENREGGRDGANAPKENKQLLPLTPKEKSGEKSEKGENKELQKGQLVPLTAGGQTGKRPAQNNRKPEKKGPTVEDIPNLFHADQEILVQVTKGPIGTKGARVTTNLSIPGRNLVLLPNCSHVGVSRRVEDHEERSRLKQMVKTLQLPPNMGVICRTVGAGLKREHFQRDLDMLLDAWKKGEEIAAKRKAPVCIYQEPALEERVLRDCLTQDIDEIIVDTKEAYDLAAEILQRFDRQNSVKLKLYSNPTPIFIRYSIQQQIESISNRKVMLPSGGYLCIDETEALIAIDVNTGKNRSGKDQPETILETNMEAVKEIARQLRLRNIGGLVVLDLIDMRSRKDQMAVYRAFKQYTSEDHARIKLYPISGLGLLEMSRQRESESLESTMFEDCPYCKGRGLIKTATSVSVEIQRRLNELLARKKDVEHFVITCHPKILERLRTADHRVMDAMASEYNRQLTFSANPDLHIEEYHITDKNTGKEF